MLNHFKSAASEFAFQMAVEFSRPQIIAGLRDWLGRYTLEEFKKMVVESRMPPISSEMFRNVQPYAKYLHKFTVYDLFEALGEASPELFNMIQSMGEAGAAYIIRLRQYLLECAKEPEKAAPVVETNKVQAKEVVTIQCDKCKKSFPVPRESLDKLKECPFCKAPAK